MKKMPSLSSVPKLLRVANTSAVLKILSSNSMITRCKKADKLMPKNLADSVSAINAPTPVSSSVKDHEVAANLYSKSVVLHLTRVLAWNVKFPIGRH